jgi:hypothetical protein
MAAMRVVFGFVAALLIYVGCYYLLLKSGRYVTNAGKGMLSRAQPIYRFVGPGEPYDAVGFAAEVMFAPIHEIDRLARPGAWPGPQVARPRVQ